MLKILQARLWQYVNHELWDAQAGFRKGRGTRDQIANMRWIIKKAREFQKKIYFCFIDYAKAFDCVDHKKLWKILQEMGIPDHLTCLLRNLYADQEAAVRTGLKLFLNIYFTPEKIIKKGIWQPLELMDGKFMQSIRCWLQEHPPFVNPLNWDSGSQEL